jgi:hypothetical protein
MLGPWKDDKEMIECIMYWQKRALEAEREVEEALDYNEEMVELVLEAREQFREMELQRDYYKQQFLDKENEIRFLLGRKPIEEDPDSGIEDSDDPWKYRS